MADTWNFTSEEDKGDVQDIFAQAFAESIGEQSGGDIKVRVYYYGQLGTENDIVELTSKGTVQVASVGNVAGAVANWAIGRFLAQYERRRWFPVDPDRARRARQWFDRYGAWSLLVSWLRVIGDPLTVIAGLARVEFWRFLLLVSAGKLGRYGMVASAWLHWPFL